MSITGRETEMGRMAGKRVWVTAAANGIGRACAERIADEGADVFATDIDGAGLDGLPNSVRRHVVDATDAPSVARFGADSGPFDSVVHCVGWVHQGALLDCGTEDWARSFRINVDTFYHLLQAVLPAMRERGSGSIVCIASVAGSIKGLPARAAYGATKAAMLGLVKSVACDYVADGVRANAVCPGTVVSPSLLARVDALGREVGSREAAMDRFVGRQPMGRLGEPDEIAELALYLASDASRFMTGQFLTIDGGISI